MADLVLVEGFEWDKGNIKKNWGTHGVTFLECEEVFFNQPLIVQGDEVHSQEEIRYYVLGQTDRKRRLFIVFTIRNKKIRVISARDMNRKEKIIYDHEIEKDTKI